MLSSTLLCSYAISAIVALTREEKYTEIRPHDVVTFNLNHFALDNQLEFDFLNQHYKVQLRRNDNHKQCHYYGNVIEPHQPDGSYLSLSLCSNRGIRGTITLPNNNERLVIFPSVLVGDPQYDRDIGIYNLTDQHMIYKERSELSASRPTGTAVSKSASRHLLSSNWRNKVELYVLVDAGWTYLFKNNYGDRWYDELYSYTAELIDGASAEYEWWDWGDKGSIEIVMVTLEIMGEFEDDYSSLKPVFVTPNRNDQADCRGKDWKSNNYQCFTAEIDYAVYISEFTKWEGNRKHYGDAHLLLTGFNMRGVTGVARSSQMCKHQSDAIVDCTTCYSHSFYRDHSFRTRTVAHELGHIFGMGHSKGQVGVMGKGQETSNGVVFIKNGWVDASVRALKDYFDKTNGLSCLRDGVRELEVVDNSGNTVYSGTGSSDSDCIRIRYLSNRYNGEYNKVGTNEYKSDGSDTNYLFFIDGKWTINYRSSEANRNYLCSQSDILDCTGYWDVWGERQGNSRTELCGALVVDDDELKCIQNNEYDDAICASVYNVEDELTFVLKTDECYNDNVVYVHNAYDEYYLFYNEYYEYIDDEMMSGQWIISQYEIRVIDAVATCDEDDLLQCDQGNWKVTINNNDTIDMIMDPTATVTNGYCHQSHHIEEKKDATMITISIICVVLFIAVLVGCIIWFIYRSTRAKKVQFALGTVEDESEEEEVEVEVETNLKRTTQ